jgi:hypothetical protein
MCELSALIDHETTRSYKCSSCVMPSLRIRVIRFTIRLRNGRIARKIKFSHEEDTMATPKQAGYIRALMIELGYAGEQGFLLASAKDLPHHPTMRERSGTVDTWVSRLTTRQASEVIEYLLRSKS